MDEIIDALQFLFIHPERIALSSEILGKSQFEVRAATLDGQHNVAVKLIPLTVDDRVLVSLKKEVLAMRECESEFVVRLMGVCLWEREIGIVMERMHSSLKVLTYGKLRLTLSYTQVLQVALKIAQGLELLHSKGFVHRDVKPENVLISADLVHIKWADFGLASALLTSVVATKTNIGAGTAHFMSPEQTNPEGSVTRATDIWAFGCVVLSLLTGATPWPADWNTVHVAVAMLVDKKTPSVPDTIPSEMQTLLRRCLTWEAQDRPTASQVVSILRTMILPGNTVGNSMASQSASTQSIEQFQSTLMPDVAVASIQTISDRTAVQLHYNFSQVSDLVSPSDSLYESAHNHIYGRGGSVKDVRKGAELLKQAAEMGHPRAMFEWGMCLLQALYFVKENEGQARSFVIRAAEAHNQFAVAYCYYQGWGSFKRDWDRYFQMLQSMDASDPWVMFYLGWSYNWGSGVKRNRVTAAQWFQRAAESHHFVLGEYWFGWCHLKGDGVTVNEQRVSEFYQLAADQGYSLALQGMGSCYEHGTGVAKDHNKAIEYYKLAYAQGHKGASDALKRLGVTL